MVGDDGSSTGALSGAVLGRTDSVVVVGSGGSATRPLPDRALGGLGSTLVGGGDGSATGALSGAVLGRTDSVVAGAGEGSSTGPHAAASARTSTTMAMRRAVLNGHLDEKRALIAVEDLTGWPVDSVPTGFSPDLPGSTTAP